MAFIKKMVARFIHYASCPKCGHEISYATDNGTTHCSGCGKTIVIHNGKPTGWK